MHKKEGNDLVIKIDVKDTGKGIEEKDLKKVFNKFQQLEDNYTKNYKGTGLGLSICQKLIHLLDGEIHVESTHGEGSNFWFTFTVKTPTPKEIEKFLKEELKDFKQIKKHLNILLVEDRETNIIVCKLLLEELGNSVEVVRNGQEAIDIFEDDKFDLILMDIQMPVMDGVTATKTLRNNYKKTPPIFGLSANAMEGDREIYLQKGLDDYITKPLTRNALSKVINKWFAL